MSAENRILFVYPVILPNGTRVFWSRVERNKSVIHRGTIQGYEYVDMPWKLYQVLEDSTGRIANLHPDRIGGIMDQVSEAR